MRIISIFKVVIFTVSCGLLSPVYGQAKQPELKPGQVFYIDFPDLGASEHSENTRAGVYLPTDYTPDRRFPLLVWFGGGAGGDNTGMVKDIVNGIGFICVALPYRKGLVWKSPWSSYHTMLREVERVVPNIHPQQRACTGFSSGGAAICFCLSEKDPGFVSYFRAIMPGGAGWTMGNMPSLKGKLVYAYIGAQDTRASGFDSIAPAAKAAGADVTYNKYEAGHVLPNEQMPAIRKWLIDKMVLADLVPLMTAMRSAASRKDAGKAYAMAREVVDITQPEMTEHTEAKAIMESMRPLGQQLVESALAGPLATQQRFALDWKGCDFTAPVEAKCKETAEAQLKKILSQQPVSVEFLKKYITMWNGFPYVDEAIGHYDKLAVTALEQVKKITSKSEKNFALQKFIATWDPTPTANEARDMREALAKEEYDSIRAIPAKGTMKSRLKEFVRDYKGTNSEKEAAALLESF